MDVAWEGGVSVAADEPADRDASFTAFVAARGATLLRTAVAITGDRHLGEDLVQTALAKVYLRWDKIRDPQAAEAYVRRAVATTATSWWRHRARRPEVVRDPDAVDAVAADGTPAVDRHDAVQRALAGLSPRQRAVLVLRFFDGLTEAETATVLGCSVGSVKTHAHRGLAAMRVKLRQASDASPFDGGDTS